MSTVKAAVAAAVGTGTTSASSFDALIGELDTMLKAHPHTEKEKDKDDDEQGEGSGEGKGEGKGEMRKSFSIKLESGELVEVEDAGEMLKALQTQFETSEQKVLGTLTSAVQLIAKQGVMLKSMSETLEGAQKTIGEQGTKLASQETLIKSLQDNLQKIGNSGSGRRAVVAVTPPAAMTATAQNASNGMPEGVTHQEFFAKAMEKQNMGKITATDIAIAEASLNSGIAIPENLVSRVLS